MKKPRLRVIRSGMKHDPNRCRSCSLCNYWKPRYSATGEYIEHSCQRDKVQAEETWKQATKRQQPPQREFADIASNFTVTGQTMRWLEEEFDNRVNSAQSPELMGNFSFLDKLHPLARLLTESNQFHVEFDDNGRINRVVKQRDPSVVRHHDDWITTAKEAARWICTFVRFAADQPLFNMPDEIPHDFAIVNNEEDALEFTSAPEETPSAPTVPWDLIFWTETVMTPDYELIKVERSADIVPFVPVQGIGTLSHVAQRMFKAIQQGSFDGKRGGVMLNKSMRDPKMALSPADRAKLWHEWHLRKGKKVEKQG